MINYSGPFNLKNLGRGGLEGYRRRLFSAEKNPDRKLVYTTLEHWRKIDTDQKKKSCSDLDEYKHLCNEKNTRCKMFVSQNIYDDMGKNFLRALKEPTRVVAALVLGKELKHRLVYEVELQEEVLIQE